MDLRSSDTSERNTQDRFTLPEWLRPDKPSEYEPPRDRDTFLRNNVLHMVGMLEVFRGGGFGSCLVARTVGRVDARLRILATLLLAILVSAAQNMAFVWVMLIIVLIGLVLRPAGEISAILRPALVATVLAVCLSDPGNIFWRPCCSTAFSGKNVYYYCARFRSYAISWSTRVGGSSSPSSFASNRCACYRFGYT